MQLNMKDNFNDSFMASHCIHFHSLRCDRFCEGESFHREIFHIKFTEKFPIKVLLKISKWNKFAHALIKF